MFNWIDLLILAVVVYFVVKGFEEGALTIVAHFWSFMLAIVVAMRFDTTLAGFITDKFAIPGRWAVVVGYVILAILTEAVTSEIFAYILERFPQKIRQSWFNLLGGSLLSAVNALLLVTFFLILALSLPIRGSIKQDISSSRIASKIVVLVKQYGGGVVSEVEESAKSLGRFLTITPNSKERITLDSSVSKEQLHIDEKTEDAMIANVNEERKSRGIPLLTFDPVIRDVARNYSQTMFEKGFFSHIDEEGNDVGDRLTKQGIKFTVAGENLAYAPDLQTAHEGLMNSEGHRLNILDPAFHRIGIGVVDGGSLGKMFTQIFTN